MRAYTALDEETLRTRRFLKDWAGEGFLTDLQRQLMERDTECGLRLTNGFLRAVLFLFTLLSAAAATWLFFAVFFTGPFTLRTSDQGILLVVAAAVVYGVAEFAVSRARLYRHGVEEALAVLSVVLLCMGLEGAAFGRLLPEQIGSESIVPAAGAIASFLIYRRFGFQYAFAATMIFVALLPGFWTNSLMWRHLIVAGFYIAGLIAVALVRRAHRLDYLDEEYSVVETLLWLGLYLTFNLHLSSVNALKQWVGYYAATEFPRLFYWSTYALIWCLPVLILWRALWLTDRWLTGFGLTAALLTLLTNKPYLGLPRHPWDPMLLGVLLVAVAIVIRRWLASGPEGVRAGFTAQRLSGRDKQWMSAISTASGAIAPVQTVHASSEPTFGGGTSGGGGASSDY